MAIGGFLALLQRDAGEKQSATIRKAQEQVQRVARIVEGMLQFAVQERAVQGRRFELAGPVRNVLQKYAPELREGQIELSSEMEAQMRDAEGDPTQIEQVVDHLVRNAIQAMPHGGRLHVQVGAVGGDSLKLVVADSGRGIAPAMRERIFDPFFSTKEGTRGAGLGLSISHSIVEAHHGRILVESVEGHGSTFTVVLPAAAAAAHLS
ncbi:MAG TPA: HAMP domain-containing sensor histidine kinase, partial [Myxococcales bacterium]|nr:HAMP domain-containing sensor histidine kinase [Myxococcales bacterium]